MPGMHSGISQNNHTVVSAFQSALVRQGLVVLLILLALAVAWNVLRTLQLRLAMSGSTTPPSGPPWPEPAARRLLRVAFGLLWIFDGVLQGQSSMPLGLTNQVIQPAASGSPHWVLDIVNFGETLWSYHPVEAATATVWIQMGIGLWLLVAPRGRWSRAAGLASLGWGLVVWVFGEAFGSIFAPGLTWLFGAPGAVLFYCLAGLLVALPERAWTGRHAGVVLVRAMGVFFVGMALLQVWPGRGYWQGGGHGTLAGMVAQMAHTPQPHFLASWVTAFGAFDAAHGWAVNLAVVVALAAIGAGFLSARAQLVRVGLALSVVLCLADWVLVEDLGFLGGTGTDPNSMVPMLLIIAAGVLALARPAGAEGQAVVPPPRVTSANRRLLERLADNPTYTFRSVAAAGTVGVVLLGALPMAAAATNGSADPVLSQAINGSPGATDAPTPGFSLTDQHGQTVSLHDLRGKVVALTFLDPVCTSDCPLMAQEFRDADTMLGPQWRRVELVAIDANPVDTAPAFLRAFDTQEHLDQVGNWQYLTAALPALQSVWNDFGVQVALEPGGAMVAHSEVAYVIDARGRTRYLLDADPGPGSAATQSSFAVTLSQAIETTLHDS
jgi:cytochrome oxidase Cu insertion factor (SCO1/SenC/PrrC family)